MKRNILLIVTVIMYMVLGMVIEDKYNLVKKKNVVTRRCISQQDLTFLIKLTGKLEFESDRLIYQIDKLNNKLTFIEEMEKRKNGQNNN